MTPVKVFASSVKTRVENSPFVKSELLNTLFLICIVGFSLLLAAINFAGKPPAQNYRVAPSAEIDHMTYNQAEGTFTCDEGSIHVGHIWAAEDDEATIFEILQLTSDFDDIITSYNPCTKTSDSITREVNNTAEFKELISNQYYSKRFESKLRHNTTVTLSLKDGFEIIPTSLSQFKCSTIDPAFSDNPTPLLLGLGFWIIFIIAGYWGKPIHHIHIYKLYYSFLIFS